MTRLAPIGTLIRHAFAPTNDDQHRSRAARSVHGDNGRPCASFSLAHPTNTIAAFTSRHGASHGRLGKKPTTGLDGFDELLTLRRGRELHKAQAL